MQQIREAFGITFYKNILPRILFRFSAQKFLCSLGHIFNKVSRGIVQKQDKVET